MLEPVNARSAIHELKKKHGLSTLALSKKLGIPQSTLSKLENLQKEASLEEIIKIYSAAGRELNVRKIISQYSKYSVHVINNFLHTSSLMKEDVANCFRDARYTPILMLAATEAGIEVSKLARLFGLAGQSKAQALLELEVLCLNDGAYTLKDTEQLYLDPKTLKHVFKNTINNFLKLDKLGNFKNSIRFFTYRCNKKEFAPHLHTKLRIFFEEIENDLKLKRFQGDDTLWVGGAFDDFTPESTT